MLDNEITIEKMKSGLSKIRNKGIAAAFSYMNIIEAWGTGVPRMFREVKEYGLPDPELINLGSDFRVNLYRKPPETDQYGVVKPKDSAQFGTVKVPNSSKNMPKKAIKSAELTVQEIQIIEYIRKEHKITTGQTMDLLSVKDRRARNILSSLTKKKILKKVGVTKNTVYLAGEYFLN